MYAGEKNEERVEDLILWMCGESFYSDHLKAHLITQSLCNLNNFNFNDAIHTKYNTKNLKEPTTCFIVLELTEQFVYWIEPRNLAK